MYLKVAFHRGEGICLGFGGEFKEKPWPFLKNNLSVKLDIAPDGFNNFPLRQRMKKLKQKEMNEINKY